MSLTLRALALAGAVALTAAVSQAQDTIKIGEYASLTGKEAAFGRSSDMGTKLAIEEINAKGGVLGKKIDLVVEDNQSTPGQSATIVKKLISRDEVVAILGEVASSRSKEAAPICQAAKIPMISPSSTDPTVTKLGKYIFRVCFTDTFQGGVDAKVAKDILHLKRVAVLSSVSSAYSVGLAKYFKEKFKADGGEIAIEQKYSEGDKDFNAQLTAIKAANVDGIFVPGYYTEAALICKQAQDLELNVPIFGGDGWEAPELIEIGGKAIDGKYYTTHYSPDDTAPVVQSFVARFKARWGSVPDAMAALGYDSAEILVDAIRRAGTTERVALRQAIAETKDYPGVTGSTTIDAERNATKAAAVIKVVDGKFTFVQKISP